MRFSLLLLFLFCMQNGFAQTLTSPNRRLTVAVGISDSATAWYTVLLDGKEVLGKSRLGLQTDSADFSKGLKLGTVSLLTAIKSSYHMYSAKRENCTYKANEKTFQFTNAQGIPFYVVFQVSDDGVAFRYQIEGKKYQTATATSEQTAYHFPNKTVAWLQPMSVAKSGWEKSNPAYEEHYQQGVPVNTKPTLGAGWVYPALFKTDSTWLLITEAGMDGSWCATRLDTTIDKNELRVAFPDERETIAPNGLLPLGKLPLYSPWRVIAIGNLKTVMESSLGNDVANPSISGNFSWVKPGKSSWSWIMSKDDYITYPEQKKYIDFAADMHWQYCLVDADWDRKIGYDSIASLAKYAAAKNVGLLLWYNSSGDWNTVKYSPKSKLLTHENRMQEFSRLKEMGIKGVKIDFFGGDGRSVIQYYIDILKDAAAYNLMINFHGATLPRGWARTYPNLLTTEAIRGFENVTFSQAEADKEAVMCTTAPFIRNAFDPMDYTPMNLYKIGSNSIRRTTSAFELALSVLFLSGIQHFAESPEGMAHVPAYVKTFLQELPVQWEDVKFLDGYPGKYVVLARKSGSKWYVAGINSEAIPKSINLNLSSFRKKAVHLITEGNEPLSFSEKEMKIGNETMPVTLQPNGGFVMVVE